MLKTLRQRPEIVFALVLLWKAALLVSTSQPIPSNDAFFYDGPVVNLLLHGKYCNPALVNALPISGGEVFCAYPPLYQVALLAWMKCFGTSVLAAMGLHFLLLAAYAGLVLATLRKLRAPVWAMHFAGLFLLGITFHDRPDSLAHVFGMAAVYAVTRAFAREVNVSEAKSAGGWVWVAILSVILCLSTSLQIGTVFFLLVWLVVLLSSRQHKKRPAALALAVMTIVPVMLVLGVKFLWPHLWAGFQEHAQQTPSLTGWRIPDAMELLKVVRAAPGVLLVLAVLPFTALPAFWRWTRRGAADGVSPALWSVLVAASVAAAAVVAAALCILTPNVVAVAAYLQPFVVGVFLAVWVGEGKSRSNLVGVRAVFGLAALLVSTRAIGMTTWGMACSRDMGRSNALGVVSRELAALADASTAGVSSAYLYDVWPEARRLRLRHSDWLGPAVKGDPDVDVKALRSVKPAKLILTQFDYYRRYVSVLAQLQSTPDQVTVRVENWARAQPPDASPRWQRVVQHVSWSPVVVTLDWSESSR